MTHDADGLVFGVAEIAALHGNGFALNFVGPSGVVAIAGDGERQIGGAGNGIWLAVIESFELGKFIAEKTIKLMVQAGINLRASKVNVLGLTFKENCPDIRNSRVPDIIGELRSYAIDVHVHDPLANAHEARDEYGIVLDSAQTLPQADAMIVAVAHDHYKANLGELYLPKLEKDGVLIDVKSAVAPAAANSRRYWRL